MSIKEVEAAALKLIPKERARLAGRLLESLENLSEEENEILWTQEAERRELPKRALSLVSEWQSAHLSELRENWELAREHKELKKIPPLE